MNLYDVFILTRNYTGLTVLMTLLFVFGKYFIITMKWIFANQLDEEINKKLIKLENENHNLNNKIFQLEVEMSIIKNKYKEVDSLSELIDNIIKVQIENKKELQILNSKVNIK